MSSFVLYGNSEQACPVQLIVTEFEISVPVSGVWLTVKLAIASYAVNTVAVQRRLLVQWMSCTVLSQYSLSSIYSSKVVMHQARIQAWNCVFVCHGAPFLRTTNFANRVKRKVHGNYFHKTTFVVHHHPLQYSYVLINASGHLDKHINV